jgi:hypothetical protein
LFLKNKKTKKTPLGAGGVAQVVGHLPSKTVVLKKIERKKKENTIVS